MRHKFQGDKRDSTPYSLKGFVIHLGRGLIVGRTNDLSLPGGFMEAGFDCKSQLLGKLRQKDHEF